MAVAEILTTKKECFTIFENGRISMSKGKFEPSKPYLVDVCAKPERPQEGPIDLVEYNIWGQEIYRENAEIRRWRVECRRIDEINAAAHKKQEKAFKKRLIAIRKSYYQQEALQRKKEKVERGVSQTKQVIRSLLEKSNQRAA